MVNIVYTLRHAVGGLAKYEQAREIKWRVTSIISREFEERLKIEEDHLMIAFPTTPHHRWLLCNKIIEKQNSER